jgi:phosphoribosylformimino-5-aminoimidazole carboxamide ribotide isomerase
VTPYPAIDLKDGVCVRLVQGDMARATIYNRDPVAQAQAFEAQGFTWLHVVDLDGAFAGRPVNQAAVEAILAETSARLQLGGGIRDLATIDGWLEAGVTRVILGTAALSDPALVERAAARHPGRVALAIDARDGRVAVEGWARDSEITALDLARRFEDSGIAAIIHTDIERDGKAGGVNVEATARLAAAIQVPVIASGGVASLDDLRALKAVADTGIDGVILGRALYDGRIDGAAALELLGS